MSTEILSLSEIVQSQGGKYITHNEALRQIEGRLVRVLSRTTIAEPGAPAAGDTYIIPSGATGTDWANYSANDIAHYYGGAWHNYTPTEGIRLWINDENETVIYDGAAWIIKPASLADAQVTMAKLADFAEDTSTTTGLTWAYLAGTIRVDNAVTPVTAGTVTLTASATNYVEVDSTGTVSVNQSGFTPGRIPLAEVVTGAAAITSSTDRRSWLSPDGGYTVAQFADFDENPGSTAGLTWGYLGGRVRNDNGITDVGAGTVSLTASTTNYVEVTPVGVVLVNTSGFSSGHIPLRTLVTDASSITSSTDERAWIVAAGASAASSASIPDFSQDTASTTGLTFAYNGGNLRLNNVVTPVTAGTVTLTASTTNYIEVDSSGTVSVNQAGFTAGRIPLFTVTTGASSITSSTDERAWLQFAGGDFMANGSVPMTGDLDMGQHAVTDYTEKEAAISSSGTATIDLSTGRLFEVTLTANTTIAFSNVPAAGVVSCTLVLIQDSTGGWTVTWPASVKWNGGTAPTISTGAGAIDIVELFSYDGGTTWYGFTAGQGMA